MRADGAALKCSQLAVFLRVGLSIALNGQRLLKTQNLLGNVGKELNYTPLSPHLAGVY